MYITYSLRLPIVVTFPTKTYLITMNDNEVKYPKGIRPKEGEYFNSPLMGDSTKHYLRIKEVCLPNVKGCLDGYDYYDGNEEYDLYKNKNGEGITVTLNRKDQPFSPPASYRK